MVKNLRHFGHLCLILWLAGLLAEPLLGQEGGRGPRDRRGGERRPRGDGPGEASADPPSGGRTLGPRGSGFPGGGMPMGSPGGGRPWGPPGDGSPRGGGAWGAPGGGFQGGGPGGWMARLDTNGNGMLDPDEAQGRARMFLERTGLDLSRPLPMDKVTRAFEEMRGRRDQEAGRGEEGGGGDRAPVKEKPPALVPGFGEPDLFDPVPGFGDLGEKFAVAIEEEDRQEALRTMARSDANQDGVLDADEIHNGRWSDDPLQTDRNRDGKLTLSELALRYAIRRVEREKSGGTARSGARNGGEPRRGGQPDSGGDPRANQDGRASRGEFAAAMAARFGGRGGSGGPQGESGRWFPRREGEEVGGGGPPLGAAPELEKSASTKKSYRIRTSAERLADISGLPGWFARLDANGDGQVSMAEYSASWNEQTAADFVQFDLNQDGIVTPEECARATEAGAVQGAPPTARPATTHAQRPREREGDRERNREDQHRARPAHPEADTSTLASTSTNAAPSSGGADMQKYVKYAVSFIRRYDTNQDGVLTEDEWSKMDTDYSTGDADRDGRITPIELATLLKQK